MVFIFTPDFIFRSAFNALIATAVDRMKQKNMLKQYLISFLFYTFVHLSAWNLNVLISFCLINLNTKKIEIIINFWVKKIV